MPMKKKCQKVQTKKVRAQKNKTLHTDMRAEKVRYLLLILLITCQRKIQMTTPQSVIFYEYLKKKNVCRP